MINGREEAALFSKSYYRDKELHSEIKDEVRRMTERLDSLDSFVVLHSINGGTGSGLAKVVGEFLEKDYKKKVKMNYTIQPSPNISTSTVEPYNAMFGLESLIENSDLTVLLDNE